MTCRLLLLIPISRSKYGLFFISPFPPPLSLSQTRHLQVQQLVESGDESSLGDVQEAYDIPQEKAELIVEVSIGREREREREGTLLVPMR